MLTYPTYDKKQTDVVGFGSSRLVAYTSRLADSFRILRETEARQVDRLHHFWYVYLKECYELELAPENIK